MPASGNRHSPVEGLVYEVPLQIAAALREHPDGEIFLSLFKGTVITAAELLAEIGNCRARYPTRDTLAADAGQAAVAIESGKWKTAGFRRACNKRLRVATRSSRARVSARIAFV